MDFARYWAGRIFSSGPRQLVMIAQKPLAEIAAYSVAMPSIVGLCLWVLLGPFRIDRFFSLPIPGTKSEIAGTAIVVPVAMPTVVLFPVDDGRLLAQMRGALVAKGYSVGP